jgi:hypothetical protein
MALVLIMHLKPSQDRARRFWSPLLRNVCQRRWFDNRNAAGQEKGVTRKPAFGSIIALRDLTNGRLLPYQPNETRSRLGLAGGKNKSKIHEV